MHNYMIFPWKTSLSIFPRPQWEFNYLSHKAIVASDTPEPPELAEKALDAVTLLEEIDVVGSLGLAVALRWNDDPAATFSNPGDEMAGIVRDDGDIGIYAVDWVTGNDDNVALPGRADRAERKTEGFGGGVDLGAQPAARPAETLSVRRD